MKEHFSSHEYNPFNINVTEDVHRCRVPALFVYCEKDRVIPAENSLKIIKNFNNDTRFEKLIIE